MHQALLFRAKSTSCTSFSDFYTTDFSVLSLPLHKYPLIFFIFFLQSWVLSFPSCLPTQLVTGDFGKSCSLRQEHTTLRACKNCNLGSPNKVCAWRCRERKGQHRHLKFQTNFEVGREDTDSLEYILCLFKRASSSLKESQCTFPLAQLSPWSPSQGTPLLLSSTGNVEGCPSCWAAPCSTPCQLRTDLTARAGSRCAEPRWEQPAGSSAGTAQQLLCARARDTARDSCFYDLLRLLEHRILATAFQQLSPNIYGRGYLVLITEWLGKKIK